MSSVKNLVILIAAIAITAFVVYYYIQTKEKNVIEIEMPSIKHK